MTRTLTVSPGGGSPRDRAVLVESDVVRVHDVCCRAPRSPYAADEWAGSAEIIVVRRGAFVVRQRGGEMVADPAGPLVLGAGEYQVCHPGTAGDDCTVLIAKPSLLQDALGGAEGRRGTARRRDLLAIALARQAARRGTDALERQEGAMLLMSAVARAFRPDDRPRAGRPQRARVEQVRALLGATRRVGGT